jgi:hypothetical protein
VKILNKDEELYLILSHFYNKLVLIVKDEQKKLEKDSIYLTLLKLPQNKISRYLTESSIKGIEFNRDDLLQLSELKHIRPLDELGISREYIITIFGLWFVEESIGKIDLELMLNYLQDTKFSFKASKKPLKDIERIVLFSMLCIRNFNEITAMDLNDKQISDNWVGVFNSCSKFLVSLGMVKKEEWRTNREGNEHPISYVMRRANELERKSKHIYQKTGNNQYFLKLFENEKYNNKLLIYLFKLIFNKTDSLDTVNKIYDFCCDLAYDQGMKVRSNFDFIDPSWDSKLKDALQEFLYQT